MEFRKKLLAIVFIFLLSTIFPNTNATNLPRLSITNFEKAICEGIFNTPCKKPASKRRKIQDEFEKKLDIVEKLKNIPMLSILDNIERLKSFGIEYTIEAISYIIMAYNIKHIKFKTPFGVCFLNFVSNRNYMSRYSKITGHRSRYKALIPELSEHNIYEKIQKILYLGIEKSNIKIYYESTILYVELNVPELADATMLTNCNSAAVICGIFISETIRTFGKMVRSAFKEWPTTVEVLEDKFIISRRAGNSMLRNYIAWSSRTDGFDPSIRLCVEKSLESFSPIKDTKQLSSEQVLSPACCLFDESF